MCKRFIFLPLLLSIAFSLQAQSFDWARHLAGRGQSNMTGNLEGDSNCEGIAVDQEGYVYIGGTALDSVDADPEAGEYWLVPPVQAGFFGKYSPQGELEWVHLLDPNWSSSVMALAVNPAQNLVIAGDVADTFDLDYGPGSHRLGNTGDNVFFIAGYDPQGDLIWASDIRLIGNTGGYHIKDLALDGDGNVYLTASFWGALDPVPGPASDTLSANGTGIFFAKYNSMGALVWAHALSDAGPYGGAVDIHATEDGHVVISGFVNGSMDFDPGPGTLMLTGAHPASHYVARFDTKGNLKWAHVLPTSPGGSTSNGAAAVATTDKDGNVFFTGNFYGTVDFDPDTATSYLTSTTYSTFFMKFDSTGDFQWVKGLIGPYCVVHQIELDYAGNIVLAGCLGAVDFDPGPDYVYVPSAVPGAFTNFVAQYDPAGNYQWVNVVGNNGISGSVLPPVLALHNEKQYLGGGLRGTGDFDPDSTSEYLLTETGMYRNAFFAQYSGLNPLNLGADTVVCPDDPLVLDATQPNGTYVWNDGSTEPTLEVREPGLYAVTVTIDGCSYADEIVVSDCPDRPVIIEFPNVFTPNGDGISDAFLPYHLYNVRELEISYYDRWGRKLATTKGTGHGWNGKAGARDCPEGVYYYLARYWDVNGVPYRVTGTVTLFR